MPSALSPRDALEVVRDSLITGRASHSQERQAEAIATLSELVERAGEPVAWINPQVLDAITRHGFLDRVNHRVRLRSSPKASENSVPLYALNTAPGASHER